MQRLSSALPHRFPIPRVSPSPAKSSRVCAEVSVMDRKRRMEPGVGESSQKKALSLRKNNARSARSISYIQIFGTGMDTGETSPCVLLFFDSKRFVFNAGEGLQRFCQENKIKLSKVDHVLLTRVCSETAGGLAGALLTLAGDVGLTLNIWGPSDLQCLITAMSTYLPNASFFYTHAFGKDGKLLPEHAKDPNIAVLLEDDLVKISAVLLVPFSDKQGKKFRPGDVAVVYVCELPEVRGKFDPVKAAALGLRPGRKYALLQSGTSVLSDDGTTEILPESVMEPSSPGPKVILVDCPTMFHIPSLLTANGLKGLYTSDGAASVACIVHMSPAIVVNDSKYQDWMRLFGSTEHILAGSGCSNSLSPILKSSAKILSKLNFACPYVFPVPGYGYESSKNQQILLQQQNNLSVTIAKNLLKFRLLPLSGLGMDGSSVPEAFDGKVHTEELIECVPEILPLTEKLKEFWKAYGSKDLVEEPWFDKGADSRSLSSSSLTKEIPDTLKAIGRKEVELIFLGTGSSQPSTYRNVSAIYVHLFANGGMLLDCGEGTYGQLLRRFGPSTDSVVAGLRLIWISHIHADHHGGLSRILSVRRQLLSKSGNVEPLLVVGPKLLKRVLEAYDMVEDLGVEFLDCSQTTLEASDIAAGGQPKGFVSSIVSGSQEGRSGLMQWVQRGYHLRNGLDEAGRSKLQDTLQALGLSSLVSVPVIHCPHAFGVVLEAQNKADTSKAGWKLAYSGDTRPCKAFIEASYGATVFIHEATFEDGMSEEAVSKMHSSTHEAIQAGALARAYRTILTHFSQRYSKVPVFDDSYNDRTCVAFDLMSIDLVDLPLLPSLIPVLKLLFKDDQAEEQAVPEAVAQ
ncbi:tRNAse Z TRZ4, mitochondrial isoform X2 [Selaginella moellendorffii]|uniref:tRNAse Z TRZ4, mitochondrial isoform X2 n=1 Tax=Selaginella moellendorffii TaxID=88036 RepID=UPI000D1C4E7E|nr:tRNAse Z TRZ4, mitochondrial isoform X2 [Selaginella moellendorffii]|eukprot:XP_024533168.1 tRNAse Z TRZ4, mitochondrial isoform X2 [Selaginella moellendorffii]